MSRRVISPLLLITGLLVTAPAVLAAGKPAPAHVRAQLRTRIPEVKTAATVAARNTVYTCFFDESVFLDFDGDDELSRGDQIIANGGLVDRFGRKLGTWEGTLTDSSAATFSFNITLRFTNDGTIVINGAAYRDGTRSGAFVAPVVGSTGRYRVSGQAGLGFDDKGNLIVKVGVR